MLLDRVRVAAWIMVLVSVFYPIGDLCSRTAAHPGFLWRVHALRLAWFLGEVALLRASFARRHVRAVAVVGAAFIPIAALGDSFARETNANLLLVVAVLPFASASLLPWGLAAQSILLMVCIGAVAAENLLTGESYPHTFGPGVIASLVSLWAASLVVAYEAEASRHLIENHQRELERLNRTLEQRVAERTERLSLANDETYALVHTISHNLHSPLRSMDGFAAILLEERSDSLDERARAHLNTIRSAAERMGRLIDALLSLTRLSRHELHRESIDLSAMATAVAEELGREEPARSVEFDIRKTPSVSGDPKLLRTVMRNLLENAWKYSAARNPAHISFGATSIDGEVVYQVTDDGVGFDMSYSGKLFDTFEQLHPRTEFSGVGIGLAAVNKIVELHGGRVWGESVEKSGAVFSFTIPEGGT
ncbi:MAG: hypothetical protein HY899_01375 [Deltaproteobacteria bacterium]|nr:hypothetical protein [Deltaproteobacteria bacterium]